MTCIYHLSLDEFISATYEEMLCLYGDTELAAVAASTIVNDVLNRGVFPVVSARPTSRRPTPPR